MLWTWSDSILKVACEKSGFPPTTHTRTRGEGGARRGLRLPALVVSDIAGKPWFGVSVGTICGGLVMHSHLAGSDYSLASLCQLSDLGRVSSDDVCIGPVCAMVFWLLRAGAHLLCSSARRSLLQGHT